MHLFHPLPMLGKWSHFGLEALVSYSDEDVIPQVETLGSECLRQEQRTTGMTFDLQGSETHQGSRKSSTSLSA